MRGRTDAVLPRLYRMAAMTKSTSNQDLGWFIDTVLLTNIKDLICTNGQHYLGFGVVACGIEFLGACIDALPFDAEKVSRQRFEAGIKTLFDAKYNPFADKSTKYDLYKHLRCGMAHIMRPQGRVGFTTQAESVTDGTTHLQILTPDDKLVLVSETFYADFADATKKMKHHMNAGAYTKKLSDHYLPITEFKP